MALIEPGVILTPIWGKFDMTPPTGPYAPTQIRLGTTIVEEIAHGTSSEGVADCIAEAISTDDPKLRWLVGYAAARNVANRRKKTDEEYIQVWHGSDEDWKAYVLTDPTTD